MYTIEKCWSRGEYDYQNNIVKENRYVVLDDEGMDFIGEHMSYEDALRIRDEYNDLKEDKKPMETKQEYKNRIANNWNATKLRELEVLENLELIKNNYLMGLISVDEFTTQNIELLQTLKKELF